MSVESQEQKLAAWKRRADPVLIVAAIVPLVVGLTDTHRGHPAVWLDLVSWFCFIADYVVHLRLRPGYARSRGGIFDAVIVVFTAPLYLVPGFGRGRVMAAARLLRLGRVFVVSSHSRKIRDLGRRLGQAALYSSVLIVVCALIIDAVEPASRGFHNIGDCLWWAIVTFTTVGYGDLSPVTGTGRVAAVFLMVGGVALIGSLAASLGSFLNKNDESGDDSEAEDLAQQELLLEVRTLRAEIAALRQELLPPDTTS